MTAGLSRIVVAVLAIPVFVCCTLAGGWYFFVLIETLVAVGAWESLSLARRKGAQPQMILGIFFSILPGFLFHYEAMPFVLPLVLAATVLVLGVELFRNNGSPWVNVVGTLFPIWYVGFLLASLILLRSGSSGDQVVFLVFAGLWACDTLAYYGGMWLGRHKLFERVSPKKTWEGAVAGFIGSIIGVAVVQGLYAAYAPGPGLSWTSTLVIGVLAGTAGQVGDLAESLLKRDAQVKDSSSLLPGHGGILDRFDSLLFVAPAVYIYLNFFVH